MQIRVMFAGLTLSILGCGRGDVPFEGPTNAAFTGQLVQAGQPVSFTESAASLQMFSEKGQSFGIPLTADGKFTIGEMPVGKYTVNLLRESPKANSKSNPQALYSIPSGLTIEAGKTDYTVELGKGFKK